MKKTLLIVLLAVAAYVGFYSFVRGFSQRVQPQQEPDPSLRTILFVSQVVDVIRSPRRQECCRRCLFYPSGRALDRAFELLSEGNQVEAEEVVSWAVLRDLDNPELLFAKAVLERSRWSKWLAAECFYYLLENAQRDPLIAAASDLALQLDQEQFPGINLAELIRLSDENPDNIYLLWLSAIQCREQSEGELGRQQYEKLLSRFEIGPVMVHHTCANILSEELSDHETALTHRNIAVALEEKSWTLQGLANTLTYSGRYDEACEIWEKAVQLDPDDSESWGNWGWTLRETGRYEEALEKHLEACRLNQSSSYNQYYAGKCLEELGRFDEMMPFYGRAAELEDERGQFKMGYLYHTGIVVGQDFEKAAEWYRLAADQGHAMAWSNLGLLYGDGKGVPLDYDQAIACFKKALEMDPNHAHALNGCAWLLATCKDESFRDYPKAVELAERSVEQDEQSNSLDTLAVAYDRNGQYDKAVEAQKRLIALRRERAPGQPVPETMLQRLQRFEKKAAESNR
jgi:tetratricopeptide (TPR) repeat protein